MNYEKGGHVLIFPFFSSCCFFHWIFQNQFFGRKAKSKTFMELCQERIWPQVFFLCVLNWQPCTCSQREQMEEIPIGFFLVVCFSKTQNIAKKSFTFLISYIKWLYQEAISAHFSLHSALEATTAQFPSTTFIMASALTQWYFCCNYSKPHQSVWLWLMGSIKSPAVDLKLWTQA